jgi:homoserine kinase
MSLLPQTVTVRVPSSTSNCGAGFDTLGLALQIYNRVTLSFVPGSAPQAQSELDARAQIMVEATAAIFYAKTGRRPLGFRYHIEGDVPPARGLGSSVTVVAGVLAGLDALHGAGLSRHQMVEMATQLEGHPDNASAGILGGFCVARCDPATGVYRDTIRFEVGAEVAFVVVSPAMELLTKESRGALPEVLPYFDAVKSINSAAYVVAAFATRDYARLRDAAGDFMHEPYRLPKIKGSAAAITAGIKAGAFTGWLSGSGSSVLCVVTTALAGQVGAAMAEAFSAVGVASEVRVLHADNTGLCLESN